MKFPLPNQLESILLAAAAGVGLVQLFTPWKIALIASLGAVVLYGYRVFVAPLFAGKP